MGLISSRTLLLYRVSFLLSFAYFFVKDPVLICRNFVVVALAQSMEFPQTVLRDDNPLIGLIAVIVGLYALQDLPCLGADNYLDILEINVPIRLSVYFGALSAGYLLRPLYLNNSLIFVFMFFEMFVNFWLFTAVREERNELSKRQIREGAGEDEGASFDKDD